MHGTKIEAKVSPCLYKLSNVDTALITLILARSIVLLEWGRAVILGPEGSFREAVPAAITDHIAFCNRANGGGERAPILDDIVFDQRVEGNAVKAYV